MPTHHGVRVHDDQGCAPVPPGVGEPYPKESIPRAKLRPLAAARQRGQLLTERQVLRRDRSVAAGDQSDEAHESDKGGQHALSCRAFR